MLIGVIWWLQDAEIGILVFLGVLCFIFTGISVYFICYHRKRRRLLDDCLINGLFSVISGTLDGIQRLKRKRVRYIIDGRTIDGTLIFSGFPAFQNTRVLDVITTFNQPIKLYLLPGGLIAGVLYPELDSGVTRRPVAPNDWRLITQLQWGGLKLFALVSLFLSLLMVATCWFIEHQLGGGWVMLGALLAIFNGTILLFIAIHVLINWLPIRAILDKYHPSVHVQVYRGTAVEWYLTGTRYGDGHGGTTTAFHGWIRLSGALHQIQHDVFKADQDPLEPLKWPMQLEYLVYKGRLIFLRSTNTH